MDKQNLSTTVVENTGLALKQTKDLVRDGKLPEEEAKPLLHLLASAYVAAEATDRVIRGFSFRLKVGPEAPLNKPHNMMAREYLEIAKTAYDGIHHREAA